MIYQYIMHNLIMIYIMNLITHTASIAPSRSGADILQFFCDSGIIPLVFLFFWLTSWHGSTMEGSEWEYLESQTIRSYLDFFKHIGTALNSWTPPDRWWVQDDEQFLFYLKNVSFLRGELLIFQSASILRHPPPVTTQREFYSMTLDPTSCRIGNEILFYIYD